MNRLKSALVLLVLLYASPLKAESYRSVEILANWINDQFLEIYPNGLLLDGRCDTRPSIIGEVHACSYRIADVGYAAFSENADGVNFSSLIVPLVGEAFEADETLFMQMSALLIFATGGDRLSFDEANLILRDMYNRSFDQDVASGESINWTFALAEADICFTNGLSFLAHKRIEGIEAGSLLRLQLDEECNPLPPN